MDPIKEQGGWGLGRGNGVIPYFLGPKKGGNPVEGKKGGGKVCLSCPGKSRRWKKSKGKKPRGLGESYKSTTKGKWKR